jgi:hypothetical protein
VAGSFETSLLESGMRNCCCEQLATGSLLEEEGTLFWPVTLGDWGGSWLITGGAGAEKILSSLKVRKGI